MMKQTSQLRAFTLIEIILVAMVVGLVSAGALDLLLRVMTEDRLSQAKMELAQEGSLVMEALMKDLSKASSATLGGGKASDKPLLTITGPNGQTEYIQRGSIIERRVPGPGKKARVQPLASHATDFTATRSGNLLKISLKVRETALKQNIEQDFSTEIFVKDLR